MRDRSTGGSIYEGDWPPAPEALPRPVLDSHTHLDLQGVNVDEALQAAADVGVERIVQVGVDVQSSHWGANLAEEYSDVLATAAVHPNEAPLLAEKPDDELNNALAQIDALVALDHVHGVGETGLDYFRTEADGRAAQEESFRAHIEIAKRYNKTLMIHDREAHDEVLRVLDSQGAPERVIFHCFSGNEEFARRCVERGYFLSFAGNVTFKNAGALRGAVCVTPRDQLLVETDGPFLTPMPHRGKPNGPYLIPHIVRYLATLRNEGLDDFCAALWANGERAFGL